MLRKLCLLRHGNSLPHQDDHARPLSPAGHEEAQHAVSFLQKNKFTPDFILCSSAKRTQETMEALFGTTIEHFIARQLYLADPDMILMQAAGVEPSRKTLLLIGHNPGISELALHLGAAEMFPTCGLGIFHSTAETWAEISPRNTALQTFFTP